MRCALHVARTRQRERERRTLYRILFGKSEGKRSVGRARRRWEDVINLRKIGWEGVGWMHLAQDRVQLRALMNTVMNLLVPLTSGNFLTR